MTNQISQLNLIILALSLLKGIGPTFIKRNLLTIKKSQLYDLGRCTEESLTKLLAFLNKKYSLSEVEEAVSKARDILAECDSQKIGITSVVNDNYPKRLLELKDPPSILYFIGSFSLLENKLITVIGTRKPNEHGKIIAERVGQYFYSQGWGICNGLADGIDSFAIRKGENGYFTHVVGVVGCGLSESSFRSLPKQSIFNIENILANNGLVVSEMPPLKKQDTFSVVKSCRIQAGLGYGLILVQSSTTGGSRFTIKAAVESNKPIGVVYPVKMDIERDDYGANKKIIKNGITGLNECIELNNNNNFNSEIFILTTKESYPEFEAIVEGKEKVLVLNS
jgi:DNA processing protein